MEGKYFIVMNMKGNLNLPVALLGQNRKCVDQQYHGLIPLEDNNRAHILE